MEAVGAVHRQPSLRAEVVEAVEAAQRMMKHLHALAEVVAEVVVAQPSLLVIVLVVVVAAAEVGLQLSLAWTPWVLRGVQEEEGVAFLQKHRFC